MEEVKIRELSEKSSINTTDHLVIEDQDGTKKVSVKHFRSLVLSTLYFDTIKDLKESSAIGLKEGDVCETLGYHTPGDGGGARYVITYNPSAVDDGKLVHYLSYSDTLRAEIVLGDVININQFGAIGDGVTDDSNAIQAAINNSDSRIIEFSNNKKYCVNESINIEKSNTIIKGNGAILYPVYTNGITVTTPKTALELTNNITIDNLNIDCSRATAGVYITRASKVHLNGCNIDKASDAAVRLMNTSFITISSCKLDGNNTGSLIHLMGEPATDSITVPTCKFIDVEDTKFTRFSKAINIESTGSDTNSIVLNLNNCNYHSEVNNACCIYATCKMELLSINTNTVSASTTFLYTGGVSGGTISCKDISCLNTRKIFDIGSNDCLLHLDGILNVSSGATVFENLVGKLYSNIMWETLTNGASFTNSPIGEINDVVTPYNYNDYKGYTITGSKLTLTEARNIHVNWSSSTNNLNEIVNGAKGQLIYIRSTTNKSIISVPNKIAISDKTIKLGAYYGVLLRFNGTEWIQVSNLTPISAINNNLMMNGASSIVTKDTNTTYSLFKDNDEIVLVSSDNEEFRVTDDDTKYSLESFGLDVTADELNRLSGLTVTKDELAKLDGLTASTEELNALVGITGNIQTQLDSKAFNTNLEAVNSRVDYTNNIINEFKTQVNESNLLINSRIDTNDVQINNLNTKTNNTDTKLDALIAKVNRETSVKEVIIPASNWSSSAPYTQTVTVSGVTSSSQPEVYIKYHDGITADNGEDYADAYACINKIETTTNAIIATAYSDKPQMDVHIFLKGAY